MIKELLIIILIGITFSEAKPNSGNLGKNINTSSNNGGRKNFFKNNTKVFSWLEQLEDVKKIGQDISQKIVEGFAINLGKKFTGQNPCNETHELKLWKKDILHLCFEKNYTTVRCPPCTQRPIEVELSKVSLIKIDLKKQTITTTFKHSFKWYDDRVVSMSNQSIDLTHAKEGIWIPQVNINQLIKAESQSVSGLTEKLFWKDSGRFLYITNGKYEIACQMDFKNFPFDNQTCTVEVSYFLT